ncbi:HLA class II histocompatibility antigen, DO alpha chain isoform X3 [Erinaceus europaeus]|uniref:HLA class II histocompatibility antigen, DO alpha chain isoform X3 n=1 Tax=Erinaceus europaeus TaxID=9365 RepID=A0ABM3X9Q2_ERIEU|nr:HLA class II histocompatibility antigen, DO alpha chain isoform X3 [Erinaceus europaeus]
MGLNGGLVLGLHTLVTLLSLQEAGAIKADHMGSYGPAFYQSYDGSGQFTNEFDGEQLFSVSLKEREAAWRLPEFGNFAYFDPQRGLASIAVIKAHLDVLVERSNYTRASNEPQVLMPLPNVTETLVCALGLAIGLVMALLREKDHGILPTDLDSLLVSDIPACSVLQYTEYTFIKLPVDGTHLSSRFLPFVPSAHGDTCGGTASSLSHTHTLVSSTQSSD